MSSRTEHLRAQAQARLDQHISLLMMRGCFRCRDEVASIVQEAKRRNPSANDELVSTVTDEIACAYFRHALRNR